MIRQFWYYRQSQIEEDSFWMIIRLISVILIVAVTLDRGTVSSGFRTISKCHVFSTLHCVLQLFDIRAIQTTFCNPVTMRRIARATRPWDLIPAANTRLVSNSPICLFCQHRDVQRRTQRPAFSTSSRPQANDDVSFLERTRRRLWGTDQPPGAEDPYTGKPRQARQKVERQQALEKKAEEETTADIDDITTYEAQALREEKELFQAAVLDAPNHEGYVPAQTWDGLETVGGEAEWNSGKVFKGYVSSL